MDTMDAHNTLLWCCPLATVLSLHAGYILGIDDVLWLRHGCDTGAAGEANFASTLTPNRRAG